jgi:ribosome-binding factor A
MSKSGRAWRRGPSRAAAHCDGIAFGDPIRGSARDADPKTLQLCAQARRALELAIGLECRDELLNELEVMAVTPEPTVRRLRVWLRAPRRADEAARADTLRHLAAARGFLRAQVAGAIHRKRTPELVFELVPVSGVGEGVSS